MGAKKIVPCLDFKDGKVVKGVNFVGIKEVGDPVECAKDYEAQGADELVFLDISATNEGRKTMVESAKKVAEVVKIPFTVGGGIASVEDAKAILDAGADKVSINSAAVKNPDLINEIAKTFGSEKLVVAIDIKKKENGDYTVVVKGGTVDAGLELVEWAKEVERRGAGAILLTSMDADGTKDGYDIPSLKAVCDAVNIPVTASGGCGKLEDFAEAFEKTTADAALAASMFHFKEVTVKEVKEYLKTKNISVNL